MPANPPLTLTLTPVTGKPRTLREQLTTFHLALIAIDPYARSHRPLVPTIDRILHNFAQADCRVAILAAGDADQTRIFLGEAANKYMIFTDPNQEACRAFGITHLPAFLHIEQDGSIAAASNGWNPPEWNSIAEELGRVTSWNPPVVPMAGDPAPFAGSPVD